MNTAFEAITTRTAWHAAEAIAKYEAVMVSTGGLFAKADGSGSFVGIAQYPAEAANDMVTVVRGAFPAIAVEDIVAGDKLTINTATPGRFRIADTQGDIVYGTALTDATTGNTFTLLMSEVSQVIPQ